LTILMPVYNSEKFLREAIDSVLTQTFDDFEFIIINDGSNDDSDKIIRSYNDPRIRYYQNKKNEGIASSLNKGIDLAKAEWIVRMDADDVCYPNRFQQQRDFIMAHPDGALFSCAVIEVDEQRRFVRKDNFHPDHFYYNLTFSNRIYHSSMVYRKECVEAVGKYTTRYAEDWELSWQLSRHYKIYHQSNILMEYRLTPHSLSRLTKKKENNDASIDLARRNIRYYVGEYKIESWILESLINVEEAAQKKHPINGVLKCLKVLSRINKKILEKKNINLDNDSTRIAAKIKKQYFLNIYFSKFGKVRGTLLFVMAGEWALLYRRLTTSIKRVVKSGSVKFIKISGQFRQLFKGRIKNTIA
jgi:glycosyltransferase involved in cell wall biosynthesis